MSNKGSKPGERKSVNQGTSRPSDPAPRLIQPQARGSVDKGNQLKPNAANSSPARSPQPTQNARTSLKGNEQKSTNATANKPQQANVAWGNSNTDHKGAGKPASNASAPAKGKPTGKEAKLTVTDMSTQDAVVEFKADAQSPVAPARKPPAKRPIGKGGNFLAKFDNDRLACRTRGGSMQSPNTSGLSRGECLELFRHYDVNQNGLLDKDELEWLAADIVDRIPDMYKEMLARSRPGLSQKALNSMVHSDMKTIMPGDKAAVVAYLKKNLPFNYPSNKKIREEEFGARWNGAAKHMFAGLNVEESQGGGLQCSIL